MSALSPLFESARRECESERVAFLEEIPAAVSAEQAAKAKAEAAWKEAQAAWLESEWQPLLEKRKEEAKAQRLEAELALARKQRAELDRRSYEQRGMESEDDRQQSVLEFREKECSRLSLRAQTPRVAASIARSIEMVLEMRGLEIRWKQSLEERRLEEQRLLLLQMEERKERDYREWRSMVHEERLRRLRQKHREEHREASLREWKRMELLGRDALREDLPRISQNLPSPPVPSLLSLSLSRSRPSVPGRRRSAWRRSWRRRWRSPSGSLSSRPSQAFPISPFERRPRFPAVSLVINEATATSLHGFSFFMFWSLQLIAVRYCGLRGRSGSNSRACPLTECWRRRRLWLRSSGRSWRKSARNKRSRSVSQDWGCPFARGRYVVDLALRAA